MKRWTSIAAVTLGTVGLMSATGIGGVMAKTKPAAAVTVPMFAYQPPWNLAENMNTNWFTHYVDKRFHMHIVWNLTNDLATKQPVLLESGNYPPVIFAGSFTNSQVLQYAHQGVLIPLNKWIKKYAPNVWRNIQQQPGLKADTVTPSGNIYALPGYNWCYHCDWSAKMWVNGYWLKKLHLPIPTTTAQFTHVLEVFKQHGVVPLDAYTETGNGAGWHSMGLSFLMDPFIYYDGSSAYPYFDTSANGKQVVFVPTQPQWRKGLEWIHSLYAKGLIPPGFVSQPWTAVEKLVLQNKVGMVPNGALGLTPQDWKYWEQVVPPLRGPSGVQWSSFYGNQPSGATFAVTNKAKPAQIIATMRLLNFLDTPVGAEMEDFGPKGQYWTYAKKGQTDLLGQQALFNSNKGWLRFYSSTKLQNVAWGQFGPNDQGYRWRNGQVASSPFGFNGYQEILQYFTESVMAGHQPHYVFPGALWLPPSQVQQFSLNTTNITDYVQQWTDDFIVGTKSLTKDWAAYVQGLQHLGLSQYVGTAQKYMRHPFNTQQKDFAPSPADVKALRSLPVSKADTQWRVKEP